MKGTWETTEGGGGLGVVVLVIVAAALLGPAVVAAVAELLRVLLIVAGVIVGVGAASLAACSAGRARFRIYQRDNPDFLTGRAGGSSSRARACT